MTPGLGAVVFLTFCIIIVFSLGALLVYRVMNTPGAHIGSRLPKDDPTAGADDTADARTTVYPAESDDTDDGEDPDRCRGDGPPPQS